MSGTTPDLKHRIQKSWGYNPSFYFATDKYYGPAGDLKVFIDSCHGRGIAVIIDMVLNHSYGQSPLVQCGFAQPGLLLGIRFQP